MVRSGGRAVLILWCFSLSECQIVQEAAPAAQLTPLFALESSVQQVADLVMLAVSLAFPGPRNFGVLVAFSVVTMARRAPC
eukprot:NODE_22858_length_691_cov_4.994681.p2 GENE.NODE_22858_length_691_cov_4.994681~~NODE_22858_length_691_cov_4.994681.p2  ORF type:complete len:81 (+),score=29.57 NODE_22858_length_691_cov_4.994681:151-393(+)